MIGCCLATYIEYFFNNSMISIAISFAKSIPFGLTQHSPPSKLQSIWLTSSLQNPFLNNVTLAEQSKKIDTIV